MFSPIEVEIKPSRWLRWLNVLAHVVFIVLLVMSSIPRVIALFLMLPGFISLVLVCRQGSGDTGALRWDVDLGTIALFDPRQGWVPAQELESILVLPWLLVMRFRVKGQRRRLVLTPDSVSPSAFRRLCVIARLATLQVNGPDRATDSYRASE